MHKKDVAKLVQKNAIDRKNKTFSGLIEFCENNKIPFDLEDDFYRKWRIGSELN